MIQTEAQNTAMPDPENVVPIDRYPAPDSPNSSFTIEIAGRVYRVEANIEECEQNPPGRVVPIRSGASPEP